MYKRKISPEILNGIKRRKCICKQDIVTYFKQTGLDRTNLYWYRIVGFCDAGKNLKFHKEIRKPELEYTLYEILSTSYVLVCKFTVVTLVTGCEGCQSWFHTHGLACFRYSENLLNIPRN